MGNQIEFGKVVCKQTMSPLCEDLIEVRDLTILNGERKPNVNGMVHDYDEEDKSMRYLGRAIISFAEQRVVEPTLKFF